MVPFSLPSIGPVNAIEEEMYETFECNLLKNYYSSVVGWIVSLRGVFLKEGKEYIKMTKAELHNALGQPI